MIASMSLLQRDLCVGQETTTGLPLNHVTIISMLLMQQRNHKHRGKRIAIRGLQEEVRQPILKQRNLVFMRTTKHISGEPSDLVAAPRSSGRKLASTIVSPFHVNNNTDGDGNVTFQRKSATRAIDFSPMEKDMLNNDMNNGLIIEALHAMDIGGSGNVGDQFQESHMDIDETDDPYEDLLGEELKEMEAAHHLASSSSTKAKSIKARSSSRGVSHHGIPCGMPIRKAEFLRRGSPKSRSTSVGLPSLGETENRRHVCHSSSKKTNTSFRRVNELEG